MAFSSLLTNWRIRGLGFFKILSKKLLLLQQWRLELISALSHVSNSFHLCSIEIPRPLPSKPYGHGTLVSLQNTRPPLPRSYGHGTLVSLQKHVCRDLHLQDLMDIKLLPNS
ncbi:hypothetical protein AT2G14265 [Arabidopsis thaliana]|uniref:Uncharacterized protein n=1 Tax=Arabidopsis thaliana TaxID=3702 RepID=A0A1P8B2D2_ARATH|nr:uncharacterized protein AT2G14265 [Arabidopsis thaliana]ANM63061.1 hypothetical protein AT2G14265 [Arabidopsis thaliana]|eukprot:NP_001325174.1 hypothetical protein AT2G14265 [Arabidopsis thaliana]